MGDTISIGLLQIGVVHQRQIYRSVEAAQSVTRTRDKRQEKSSSLDLQMIHKAFADALAEPRVTKTKEVIRIWNYAILDCKLGGDGSWRPFKLNGEDISNWEKASARGEALRLGMQGWELVNISHGPTGEYWVFKKPQDGD